MKKALAMILAMMMLVSLAACGTAPAATTETTAAATAAATTAAATEAATTAETKADATQPASIPLSADGKYPAETVKIGFVNYDTTAENVLNLQKYFEHLQTAFNFEVIYSESLTSAEGELAFIESCAAAGCKGIIGFYNVAKSESVQRAIDLGMYYWGGASEPAIYDVMKNNPMYLGGSYSKDADYTMGYKMATALIEAGSTKLIYTSGGRDFGVEFFVKRSEGFDAAIADAKAAGKTVEKVADVSGWPGTEAFAAAQTEALGKEADGLVSSFTALPWLQPLGVAGKMGQIKIAGSETVNDTLAGLFNDGVISYSYSEVTESFGMAVPMILNAAAGHADKYLQNGASPQVTMGYWEIAGKEDCTFYNDYSGKVGWVWEIDDLKTILYDFDNTANFDSLSKLYGAFARTSIEARKAK